MNIHYIEDPAFSSEKAEPATDLATRYAKKQALFEEASKATGVAIPELHRIAYGFWQAARSYALAGRPVFPVYANKRPATWHGHLDATTDLKQIDKWWSTMPLARVAMRTGEVSGIMVVDVDMHGEVDGRETLKALGLEVPKDWPIQLTPTGNGFHIPVEAIPGISSGKLGAGIDLKANDGYVVVAPSMRSFAKPGYRVANPDIPTPFYIPGKPHSKVQLPPLPDDWQAAIMATKKAEKKDRPLAPLMAADETSSYGRAALRDACRQIAGAKVGDRNKTLFRESCGIYELVAGGEITDEDAENELRDAAEECGLPDDEIDTALRNGKERGFKAPRARPVFDGGGWYEKPDEPQASSPETGASAPPKTPRTANWTKFLLCSDPKGENPKGNLANAITAFRRALEFDGVFAHDAFAHTTMMLRPAPWSDGREAFPRPITDRDDTCACDWLQHRSIDVSITTAHAAIEAAAGDSSYNPLQRFLRSTRHDGNPRIETWLRDYLGVPDSPLSRAMGWKFLVAAVARGLQPGCKADTMLVLEGEQGAGKSQALAILGGEFFSDEIGDLNSKDSAMLAGVAWIIEFPEMDATSRIAATRIKAFLSQTSDQFRPPFGRRVINAPRHCVFAGTTNQAVYLKDETGGRRFWPVTVGTIDLDALRRDRDQLLAEAVARFDAGAHWWIDEPELLSAARDEQAARYIGDPWDDLVKGYLAEGGKDVAISDIMANVLRLPRERFDRASEMRVAKILKTAGWERYQKRSEGVRAWRYRPPLPLPEGARPRHQPPA